MQKIAFCVYLVIKPPILLTFKNSIYIIMIEQKLTNGGVVIGRIKKLTIIKRYNKH